MHGNALALDAVLADLARGPQMPLVCLGDAIQGGPQPAQVVARLRDLGCPIVMGNADAYLLSGLATEPNPPDPERERQLGLVREWSLAQLDADDRAFIASFAPTVEQALGDVHTLLAFHGSPTSFDDLILPATPDDALRPHFAGRSQTVFAGGHTHQQIIRRVDDALFVNPGSIGLVFAPTPAGLRLKRWAEYAVLSADGARLNIDFRRVPYDIEVLFAVYRRSGRPLAEQIIAQYA
jgi:hypothetical protein